MQSAMTTTCAKIAVGGVEIPTIGGRRREAENNTSTQTIPERHQAIGSPGLVGHRLIGRLLLIRALLSPTTQAQIEILGMRAAQGMFGILRVHLVGGSDAIVAGVC